MPPAAQLFLDLRQRNVDRGSRARHSGGMGDGDRNRPPSAIADLPQDRLIAAMSVADYMLGTGRKSADADEVVKGLAERLVEAGLPLDRMTSIVWLLHAEDAASVRIWDRETGLRSFTFAYSSNSGEGFANSPAGENHRTGQWIELWIPDTPDDRFNVIPDLKADGIVHYISMPTTAMGMKNSFSFATRSEAGFSQEDLAVLKAVFPAVEACQEILVTRRIIHEITRMYIGDGPHERVLAGDVHRGEVMKIRSAILFADMRRFTELTADMEAEQATMLLNAYYDCVVPHIEASGGEVLKFMGDGVLAIFRAEETGETVCANALSAAIGSLRSVGEHSKSAETPFDVGIALHFGEVAYGNVGSGARLDYTVIGRDVNLASRIASLCGTLDQTLLVSEMFRERVSDRFESQGEFHLKGLSDPHEVFALARGAAGKSKAMS